MEEDVHEYSGEEIVVSYDVNRCIHARECVRGLPEVFDPDERPWIDPDETTAEAVASVVTQCPTGALHFERTDDGEDESVPEANTVTVATDGPLYLRGDVGLTTPDEETLLEDTRVALCRCGLSANKPLCDDSHRDGFRAAGSVGSVGEHSTETGEPLTADSLDVTPLPDGPLALRGEFELRGDEDESTVRDDEAALCRCGGSGDKPFCDGSHAEIGFSSE
jgi:CDGSH-type Zn-finger protein/uncharacterized Fe-S cluster protein YjdI